MRGRLFHLDPTSGRNHGASRQRSAFTSHSGRFWPLYSSAGSPGRDWSAHGVGAPRAIALLARDQPTRRRGAGSSLSRSRFGRCWPISSAQAWRAKTNEELAAEPLLLESLGDDRLQELIRFLVEIDHLKFAPNGLTINTRPSSNSSRRGNRGSPNWPSRSRPGQTRRPRNENGPGPIRLNHGPTPARPCA